MHILSSCCDQDWHILLLEFLKLYLVHFLPLTDLFCSCLRCCWFHNSSTFGQLSTCWVATEAEDVFTEITATPATSQRRVGRVTLAYNATSRLSHTLHTCTHLYTPVHTCTHLYTPQRPVHGTTGTVHLRTRPRTMCAYLPRKLSSVAIINVTVQGLSFVLCFLIRFLYFTYDFSLNPSNNNILLYVQILAQSNIIHTI